MKIIHWSLFLPFLIHSYIFHASEQKRPQFLFAHGLGGHQAQHALYTQEVFHHQHVQSFNFPEANKKLSGIGHGPDLEVLKKQINANKDYIFYGFSRGGAAFAKLLGQKNLTNVKALIIEGAPADVVELVSETQLKATGFDITPFRFLQEYIFQKCFPGYPLWSTPAYQDAAKIQNKQLPILIFHSKTDQTIPISSAWKYYISFKKAGFENVYLHEIESGRHGQLFNNRNYFKITNNIDEHVKNFNNSHELILASALRTLHTFYKKFDLPYDANLSESDDFSLEALQPPVEEIEEKLKNDTKEKYAFQKIVTYAATMGLLGYLMTTIK